MSPPGQVDFDRVFAELDMCRGIHQISKNVSGCMGTPAVALYGQAGARRSRTVKPATVVSLYRMGFE